MTTFIRVNRCYLCSLKKRALIALQSGLDYSPIKPRLQVNPIMLTDILHAARWDKMRLRRYTHTAKHLTVACQPTRERAR